MNKMREAFEAHCAKNIAVPMPMDRLGDGYEHPETDFAWVDFEAGYQAAIADVKAEREFLVANATRSISWIDGVIEILELFRPETPSQKEWQKRMVGEGYAIIQGHVEVAMLEDV